MTGLHTDEGVLVMEKGRDSGKMFRGGITGIKS